ncbi:MAG: ketoacyl-ACP synthase III [bacterium]|nr:ketoacyl-ACP synthase III [bacterium]
MPSSAILGIGSNLPEQVLTNSDLEKMVDTSDQWIRERTGIRERRIAPPDQAASELAVPACERALAEAGLNASDIDIIVLTTLTPDTMCPSADCWLQARIGASRAAAFDLNAACSGFIYGLQVSDAYIRSGLAKNVLLVSVEIMSRVIDWSDRGSSVLWGDGAGAVVLGPAENGRRGVIYSKLYSDGKDGDMIVVVGGGSRKTPITAEDAMAKEHTLKLRGRETFKTAVRHFSDVCVEALEENGMSVSDVDVFVPHQANIRIIEAVAKRIGFSMDRVVVTIDKYGNMSAATIPVALDEWVREGKVRQGDTVLMAAFGGGLTWGAALVEW